MDAYFHSLFDLMKVVIVTTSAAKSANNGSTANNAFMDVPHEPSLVLVVKDPLLHVNRQH